jgi:hypothetical protein
MATSLLLLLRSRSEDYAALGDFARAQLALGASLRSSVLADVDGRKELYVHVKPATEPAKIKVNIGLNVFLDMDLGQAASAAEATSASLQLQADELERQLAQELAVSRALQHRKDWEAKQPRHTRLS